MATIDKVRDAFAAATDAVTNLWDVLGDYENEYGDTVITDDATVDALIDVYEILTRLESRRIAELKSEYESIL